jgi:DNA mismatch repair protein MutS
MSRAMPATPMISQYRRVKDRHRDAIVFFRLGDFYETFFEDAALAARELEITLTSREAGKGRRVPMAGIPHHAAEGYIARLLDRGYRVALCDQVEDPAKAKGLVRREVTRVITPGTTLDSRSLDGQKPNYLAVAGMTGAGAIGLAVCEFSAGEFRATEFAGATAKQELLDELLALSAREIILDPSLAADGALANSLRDSGLPAPVPAEDWEPDPAHAGKRLLALLGTVSLAPWGLEGRPAAVLASAALLAFLEKTQREMAHLRSLRWYSRGDYMCLDEATRRNLELVAALRDGKRAGSLLSAVDRTVTAMGGRMLYGWILRPLTELAAAQSRQDGVAHFVEQAFLRAEVRGLLKACSDLNRLVGRAGAGLATARDLVAIRGTLEILPRIQALLDACPPSPALSGVRTRLDSHAELYALLLGSLADQPPPGLQEGSLLKAGFNEEVDRLRALRSGGKGWVAALEAGERERTGIRSLRVGYNRVFGYYLEVTRPNLDLVPDDYVRRQTLANAERFVTPELKDRESEILDAEERLFALEFELFCRIRSKVGEAGPALLETASALAELDCLSSLAEAAVRNRYVRPELADDGGIEIAGGRHPVLELSLDAGFVPNDLAAGGDNPRVLVITGPNMAGKSTYLRQAALIVLLAQIGSYVPADAAHIGLVDRIFTRIGSRDDLAAGQSTFMVEMQEVSNILRHATSRSLVILDEVGRGTSTFDGISLARAVVEHLVGLGALTLFATHYHELIDLESMWPEIANYSTAVVDRDGEIVFPHKVRRGGSDRSYGIEVARLAGLPPGVLARARELLELIERARLEAAPASLWLEEAPAGAGRREADGGIDPEERRTVGEGGGRRSAPRQLAFLEPAPDPVIEELRAVDLYKLTPLEALNLLHRWQERLRRPGRGTRR